MRMAAVTEKLVLSEDLENISEIVLKDIAENGGQKESILEGKLKKRRENWQSKILRGQYLRDRKGKVGEGNTWSWMSDGDLNRETEGLILAAQDQYLRTKAIKALIE